MTHLWKQVPVLDVTKELQGVSSDNLLQSLPVRDHPVKDVERLREAAPGRISMPAFFFDIFENPSVRF